MPFYGQEQSWNTAAKAEYHRILDSCDENYFLSMRYYLKCYFVRDEFMVDRCGKVLAVYNGSSGGTRYTIDYARHKGKQITVINPITLKVIST